MSSELYCVLYQDLVNLASFVGLAEQDLNKYFYPEGESTPRGILLRLCISLQNSGNMHNSIKFDDNRRIINDVLFNFIIEKSASYYHDWEALYTAMINAGITDNGVRENKETNWEKYCKGLYNGLIFLNGDEGNGVKIIQKLTNESKPTDDNLSTIHSISNKIHGLGFALTCDWLKECGCTWLAKPDVHIKEVVKYIKSNEKITDEDVIKYIFSWAEIVNSSNENLSVSAYIIDKMIWLLSTGDFYLDKKKIGREAIYRKIDMMKETHNDVDPL